MEIEARAELGDLRVDAKPRPGREAWLGPEIGPQWTNRGNRGGSEAHEGACNDEYLRFMGVTPKVDAPKGKVPFVRT